MFVVETEGLECTIPNTLVNYDRGKKWGVRRLGFDGGQGLSVDGDAGEDLSDQGLPLLMSYAGVRPKGGQVFQKASSFLQIRAERQAAQQT